MLLLQTKSQIAENLKILFPSIKEASVVSEDFVTHVVVVEVKLPWWKWLLPGIIHYIFRKRVTTALKERGVCWVYHTVKIV
jgi:hypothetical protein